MKNKRFLATLLMGVFTLHLLTPMLGQAANTKAPKTILVYNGKSAVESRDYLLQLSSTRRLDVEEAFYLSVAYFANQQFSEALSLGYQALGMTTEPKLKGAIYAMLSQTHAALKQYDQAAQVALTGQRLDPASKDLAALRIAYFDQLGDQAQKLAAVDHLRNLDANFDRKPVFDPVTDGIIIIETVILIINVIDIINNHWGTFDKLVKNMVNTWVDAKRIVRNASLEPHTNTIRI